MCKHEHTSSLTMFVEMSICCPIQAPCLRGYNDVIISYWLEYKDFNRLYNTRITISLLIKGQLCIDVGIYHQL